MAGPFDGHQGAAQETDSRFPHPPEEPPPGFQRSQLMIVAIVAVLALAWLAYAMVR